MKTVNVQRHELLEALQKNHDLHIMERAEALKNRRELIIKELDGELTRLATDPDYEGETIHQYPMPPDNAAAYRKAIQMVKMSVDEVIELDASEFDCYVMDNWHWKGEFLRSKLRYE